MNRNSVVNLILALALLAALILQSALDYQCMKYHADGARWTVSGVYCWRNKSGIKEYYLLEDLRAKHEGPPESLIIPPPTPTNNDPEL